MLQVPRLRQRCVTGGPGPSRSRGCSWAWFRFLGPGRVLGLTQAFLLLLEPHDAAPQAGLPGFPEVRCDAECKGSAETKSSPLSPRMQDVSGGSTGTHQWAEDRRGDGSKSPPWSALAQGTPRPGCHQQPQPIRDSPRAAPSSHQRRHLRNVQGVVQERRWRGSGSLSPASRLGSARTGDPRHGREAVTSVWLLLLAAHCCWGCGWVYPIHRPWQDTAGIVLRAPVRGEGEDEEERERRGYPSQQRGNHIPCTIQPHTPHADRKPPSPGTHKPLATGAGSLQ